jgi:hypothetical protein
MEAIQGLGELKRKDALGALARLKDDASEEVRNAADLSIRKIEGLRPPRKR